MQRFNLLFYRIGNLFCFFVVFFSLLRIINIIQYSIVRKYIGRFCLLLIMLLFGLVLKYTNKLLVYLRVQIVTPLPHPLYCRYVSFSYERDLQISCVYHGRTKGEGCGHVKSI